MPAKKKDVKHDEPVFVDSEGVFIHEAEQARYSGGVRTLTSGVLPASMIANNPSLASALNMSNTNGSILFSGEADKTMQGGGSAGGGGGSGKGNSPAKKSKTKLAAAASSTTHSSADNKLGVAGTGNSTSDGTNSKGNDGANAFNGNTVLRFRHGTGTYISPQLRYCGEWKEDVMHGKGTLEFKMSGATYSGEFVNGLFCGHGRYVWADGSCYDGHWVNNKMHGQGTFTDEHGQIWNGVYYNGTGPGLERLYRAEANRVAIAQNETV